MNKIYPLAIICLISFSIGINLAKDGQIQKRTSLPVLFFMNATWMFLLYMSGFFNQFHWPQITWFVLTLMGFAYIKKENKYNFINSIIVSSIVAWIYYKGGAFQYLLN